MARLLPVVVVCASLAASAMPQDTTTQQAVMHGGDPAVECRYSGRFGNGFWSIEQVDLHGKPALKIPVQQIRFGNFKQYGTLFVTDDRIVYESSKPEDSFDESRTAIAWKMSMHNKWTPECMEVRTPRQKLNLAPRGYICVLFEFPACTNIFKTSFTDFSAADKQFNDLTNRLPPAREAAFRVFQPTAAAWRALPVKPPLNPEADREWILAENAIKEKNTDSAVAHYAAALQIQPAWPTGCFNLAVIYAEQNNYADAADSMKRYLELVPDAPDARSAREQMIIWEDKAKH